ncbi:predicted protein [Naegleria gruberi]|uniref:Predicted protein n=1 Tax=Naegleria gruberi TaxID=5762 RepID=D2VX67_NAEGR|nr:uncharacterized protein NAEGRDRAFT_73637 [Naegleria gruberi]EFC38624.1 predicted protein [Naegleria gruberi]|eukprot:XP_002671368.1 predicted protein [Naegleria gruberi strain NEG-M]
MSSSIPKRIHSSMQFGKGIWHMIVSWIHLVLILSTMLCVSNAVKSSYIHDIQVNSYFFKSFGVQQKNISNIYHHYYHALEDTVTTGRFFVNANEQSSLNNLTIYMNNVAIHSQQLVSVSSHEEIIFNASATGFSNNERNYFWKISNGNSLLSLLTSNPLTHSITRGLLLKVNTNDLLPSIPYNFDFIGEYNSSNSNITMEYISFSFSVERLPKSNVIAQINGGLYEEYLPIYSYNTRSNLYPKESDFGSIIQSDGSLQLFSTSYDPENLPLVDFVKESFIWSCFYIKGHSYKLSGKSQLKSDISSSVLLPCTFETPVNTFESNYNIPTENLEYFNTYVICLDYSVGSRSDTTFIILRTLNANEYWAVRIFPSIDTTFMDPTKAIVLSGEIFPGGVLLSGVTSLKWEWTVSYLGREDQQETPTIVKTSSNSVLYLEPRTLLSNEKAYSSSPNIYEFSVKAIINQIYIVNSTFRRKVASKQQDSIIDSSSISIYPLLDGFNRPLLDKFVIEFPGITSSSVSAIYEIYYSIEGDTMKLLTTSTHMNKLTTWLPYSHTNQVDIHIFLQINDPSKESYNFRYWIGTRNIKLNNTSTDHNYLKATKSKIQNIQQQVIDILPNITDLMKKNNVTVFEPKIIQDIYLDLDKLCTTLNEYAAFNNSDEEGIIREQIASAAISAREQLKTLNSSNTFALSLFDLFRMDINLIQLISSLTKKPSHLSSRSISLIVDSLLHPLLVNFLKERNLFITRTIDVIDMRPTSEVNNPKVEFSSLFSTYSNSFLTILDSLLSTANANTIIVKSQVLAGFCQKWIHQLSIRLLEESAPSTAVTITNNNVEISYKRDLLSSLIGAGFGEGASVSVDYSNDTREWKVNNNLLLIQLPPEIRQQSLFISDIELNSDEIIHSNTERSTLANSLDASIISPLPLNITDQFVGFKIVTFKNTEGNSKILGNVMISVELLYNQQSLKLRNLKSPIEMVFFADQSVYLPTYLWMGGGCHFWNETTEEWSKEGCTTVASYSFLGNSKPKDSLITDDSNPGLNRIYCSCNHTTLFAVLKANTSDVELIQDFTNKVWGDITSCILILIFSVGQAIFLLSIRTPHNISLKFRGFIPFFGILVLILEALINLTRDGMIMNIFLTGVEIPFMDTIDGALRTVIDPLYCAMLVLYMLNIWQYYHKERFQFLMKKYQEKDEKYSIRRYVKFTSRSYLVMPCLTLYAAQLFNKGLLNYIECNS